MRVHPQTYKHLRNILPNTIPPFYKNNSSSLWPSSKLNDAIIFDGDKPRWIISLLAMGLSLMINASSRVIVCGAAQMSVSLRKGIGLDSKSDLRIILCLLSFFFQPCHI